MYERTGTLIKDKFKEHLLPTMLTTMALSLATMVDSIIVGQLLGSAALASIGLSTPIIYVMNIIYVMFAVGGMMCASVARGRLELEKANRLFTMAIFGGTAMMVLFLAVMLIFLDPICLALAGGDAAAAAMTREYLLPMVFTGPALILSNGVAMFMRADGKPKLCAAIVIIANAVDLALDYVFIRFLHTGIMGAGLSTTLGYVAGIVVVLPYLFNRKGMRSFRFVKVPDLLKTAGTVVKTGLPKGCSYIAALGRSLVLNSIVLAAFGTPGISVLTVLLNSLTVASIFVSGTGDALLPIVGTLYGEGDAFGIRKTVESARNVLAVACVAIVALFLLGSGPIGGLFGITAQQEMDMLKTALRMFALYVPFYAAITMLQNFYNITGREKFAVAIAVLDGFVFICLFAVLFSLVDPELLWLCYGCGSALTFLAILLEGVRIRKKEAVTGLLLLRQKADEQVWNMTIDAEPTQAVGLAHAVADFCRKNQIDPTMTNRLAVGIEELTMASATHAYEGRGGKIDVLLRLGPTELSVCFRDRGKPFDPVAYQAPENEGLITDGVDLLKAMADQVHHSSQLGFNMTVMTFARLHPAASAT